jgi:hypothetical protein
MMETQFLTKKNFQKNYLVYIVEICQELDGEVMDWACGEGCKRYIALFMGSIPHLALTFAHS